MIISHKYEFIFIKTQKTAGTSIEAYLEPHCGPNDVVTPIYPTPPDYTPRNYEGCFNPIRECLSADIRERDYRRLVRDFLYRQPFYNHLWAYRIRSRVPKCVWDDYFTFCFERNPWSKTLSRYYMWRAELQGDEKSFESFMTRGRHCFNYRHYMDRDTNEVIVDYIGRYEMLEDELEWIFEGLGVPFEGELDVELKSDYRKPDKSYREIFEEKYPEFIPRIRRIFRKEIELHGYSFSDV